MDVWGTEMHMNEPFTALARRKRAQLMKELVVQCHDSIAVWDTLGYAIILRNCLCLQMQPLNS